MTGKEFKLMSKKELQLKYSMPGVYIWKRGEVWLYVGSSHNLWWRLYGPHTILKREFIREDDTIDIQDWPRGLNRLIERGMIRKNDPLYNSVAGRGNLFKKFRAYINLEERK